MNKTEKQIGLTPSRKLLNTATVGDDENDPILDTKTEPRLSCNNVAKTVKTWKR